MSVIFWDTNLFIYLIEQTPDFCEKALALREKMTENNDILVTSALTLGELLVHPISKNRDDLVQQYRNILTTGTAALIAFDEKVSEIYAKIRAGHKSIKPPDAIQLSCASAHGVDEFYTNDSRLSRYEIGGIGKIKTLRDG